MSLKKYSIPETPVKDQAVSIATRKIFRNIKRSLNTYLRTKSKVCLAVTLDIWDKSSTIPRKQQPDRDIWVPVGSRYENVQDYYNQIS